ncbi:SDR family NAD(P)-dependent oxidoreductase [Octadecabacter sp. 1_MG-2023]|uniref:SDR family NAD(P)-dependent oxidoreductase n=1 Tax=unclassified Octadecabacter TaxID=196158 RepID=UPI001C095A06|nr:MULTISPECIES: SDR family NAD(P)-dependent oxidoreductase [unclassified Octadecabacter]MBU2994441.1 SDR family NAD(P)-dependent oxidoreductase [Octadecabacter sp. B2R22]MDO6734268.1 SDR family NAD(P)-dependent oxidoreductase [Octadecabacter sp. 1_MG-2023]
MNKALVIGTSGGIGSALAQELQSRGFAVTGVSRSGDGLDVTDKDSVERVLRGLEGPFDAIFVAIGTLAAGGAPEKALSAIDPARMVDIYAVNAVGPALVLAQLERLLPTDRASFVGVLSARVGSIGDNKIGGWHSYRASKAALNQIVRGAAIEFGRKRRNAVVVALHPGTVATEFTRDYPAHKKVSAKDAAANLCDVMKRLEPSQSGRFFAYDGVEIDW